MLQKINAAISKASRDLKLPGTVISQISELPPEIGSLTSLSNLDLSNNSLKTLPPEFVDLHKALTDLNLRNNTLGELPVFLSQFNRLRVLNVSQNGLTDASLSTLVPLTQLRDLQLASNNFSNPDFTTITWNFLETLNLSSNKLTTFPAIFHLLNLINLDLSHNQIRVIPLEITQLNNLKVLNMQYNQVAGLPNELGTMPSLKKLIVDDNPVALTLSPLSSKGNETMLLTFLKNSAGKCSPSHDQCCH